MWKQWTFPRAVSIRSIWCASLLLAPTTAIGVDWRFDVQLSGMAAQVQETDFNPGNRLGALPDRVGRIDLRPDLFAEGAQWDLMLRPRAVIERERIAGEQDIQRDTDVFVNEGRLRLHAAPGLDVSVGREHLLWGPANSLMPGNPFTPETGRDNPFLEVGGRDYVRANYLTGHWTVSLIANVGEGRDEQFPDLPPLQGVDGSLDFERIYAFKIDHVGYAHQVSALVAREEGGPWQAGGFVDWTAGMGTRLYAEGRVIEDIRTFDPRRNAAQPADWEFTRAREGDSRAGGIWLAGVSHTLDHGTTLTLEGIYNRDGYDTRGADRLLDMASEVAPLLQDPDPQVAGEAAGLLAVASSPGPPLLRRHYLFAQADYRSADRSRSVTLRYLHNVDDDGGRVTVVGEWEPQDQVGLFAVAVYNHGDGDTEFARYQRHLVMAGMRYFF